MTIQMGLLTVQQKDELVGQLWAPDSYFNPVQDGNGNWVISEQEMYGCVYPEFDWVANLPLIDWAPPPYDETIL